MTLEFKAVNRFEAVFKVQLLSYLRLTKIN
ncbi:hypothetical protein ISS22_04750 [candidate division KSB1 bacterium]|nr:hypothetical protein [candidate division KSB1 bacterium]